MGALRILFLLPVFLCLWAIAITTWLLTASVFVALLFLNAIFGSVSNSDWHGGTPLSHFEFFRSKLRQLFCSIWYHLKNFFG